MMRTACRGYKNLQTASFASYIENDAATWDEIQKVLAGLLQAAPDERGMVKCLTEHLKAMHACWLDEATLAISAASKGTSAAGWLGLSFAEDKLFDVMSAIDVSECAETWVASYLYNLEVVSDSE
jgi:hypothetical protein